MKDDAVTIHQEPSPMAILQQLAAQPNVKESVEVMKEIIAMQERAEDRQAKRIFIDALTDLQHKIPPIDKNGIIKDRAGNKRSTYALSEDICEVVDPMMHEYGFSYNQSLIGIKDGQREFAGTLLHRGGYEKTLSVSLPLDKNPSRSDVQSEQSTFSYAKRMLYKAHFNIRESEVIDPSFLETISEEQAKELTTLLKDAKADMAKFLKYFEIDEVKNLRVSQLSNAIDMAQRKATKK